MHHTQSSCVGRQICHSHIHLVLDKSTLLFQATDSDTQSNYCLLPVEKVVATEEKVIM